MNLAVNRRKYAIEVLYFIQVDESVGKIKWQISLMYHCQYQQKPRDTRPQGFGEDSGSWNLGFKL
jgi:hypothetical protein